jgi:hypothetical protein
MFLAKATLSCNCSFIVLATVITIVNYDSTVLTILNYDHKSFIVQFAVFPWFSLNAEFQIIC